LAGTPNITWNQFDQYLVERNSLLLNLELRLRASVLKQALQRANQGPSGDAVHGPGIPAKQPFISLNCHERRKPVVRLALGRFKIDQRIVAAIRRRHHNPRGPEVNSNFHSYRVF